MCIYHPQSYVNVHTCLPSSICACWKVNICCAGAALASEEFSGDDPTVTAEPAEEPAEKSLRLALPGVGEPNLSATEGPSGDVRISAEKREIATTNGSL